MKIRIRFDKAPITDGANFRRIMQVDIESLPNNEYSLTIKDNKGESTTTTVTDSKLEARTPIEIVKLALMQAA